MTYTAVDAVQRGARLLDREVPDWFRQIDIVTLDLGNPYKCILGQLFSGYENGCRQLGLDTGIYQGFEQWDLVTYDVLTKEWLAAILTRQLEASVR